MLLAVLVAYVGVTRGLDAQSPSSFQPQPTSVHIVRTPGNVPNFQIIPLDRTITDTNQVQKSYSIVLTLPPANLGACAAAAVPEAYVLTFYRNGQSVLMARAGFCPGVYLDRGNPNDTLAFRDRFATSAFWSELSHILGIPHSQLEPNS